ncbi:hypothetical protein XENOCAPTIV_029606 [Xenoophorus captivus]|uniref:Uncharacterized protein n=1 Tax=Xenoophorus captivus TaxID=1517983 RepID=A0ABV0S1E1_9TELE
MGMQSGYVGNTMQGQSPGGFNPMMNQMGQAGGFPGVASMGAMGNPRANMQRPRMMTATKPLRMNQQGDSTFMAPGSSPPGNMMQGRMGGMPRNRCVSATIHWILWSSNGFCSLNGLYVQ